MEKKSNATSTKYRTVGNKLFRKGEFLFAAIAYNKAICYAETSQQLGFAYANRSAVFLEESKYDDCLKDIEMARRNDYPVDKLEKLKEREERCKSLKASGIKDPEQIPEDYFNLSYPPNPRIPFMVDCLEIRDIADNKRGIFTKRDLKAGDIVAVEELVIKFADGGYGQVDHCYNCLKINMMNLIPCLKSASLMFCSTTCRDEFHETFDGSKYLRSQIRKMFREAKKVFGNRDDFALATWISPQHRATYFDFDLSNPEDPACKRNMWVSTLAMNGMNTTILNCSINDDNVLENDFLNDLYCKHLIRHFHLKEILVAQTEENYPIWHHGRLKLYGLRNFIKHSCVVNTICFPYDGNKMVYCIAKPIKAGEQLFRNYLNEDFTSMAKAERTTKLAALGIVCNCFACENNLTNEKLKVHDPVFLQQAASYIWEQMCGRDVKQVHKVIKVHWDAVNAYHSDPFAKEVPYLIDINFKLIDLLACKAAYPASTLKCRCFDCPKDAICIADPDSD